MKKLQALAATTLLTFTASSFAQGFYVQGGGGVGILDSGLENWGFNYRLDTDINDFILLAHTENEIVGVWTAGLGYMFTDMWGLEANYTDFGSHHDSIYRNIVTNQATIRGRGNLKTEVYQVNLLGVASVPLSKNYGVNLKGKAGAVYTYRKQSVYLTELFTNPTTGTTFEKEKYDNSSIKPMVAVGLEKSFSDMFAVSLDYYAEIDTDWGTNNSAVFTAKLMPMALMEQQKSSPTTRKPAYKHS